MSKSLSARENNGIVDSNSGSRRTTCEEIEYALHHPRRIALAGMDACRQSNNGSRVDRFGWRRVIGHPQHLTLIASYRESEALTAQMACAKRLCLYTREVRAQIRVRVWVAHRKIWAQNIGSKTVIFSSPAAMLGIDGEEPNLA